MLVQDLNAKLLTASKIAPWSTGVCRLEAKISDLNLSHSQLLMLSGSSRAAACVSVLLEIQLYRFPPLSIA